MPQTRRWYLTKNYSEKVRENTRKRREKCRLDKKRKDPIFCFLFLFAAVWWEEQIFPENSKTLSGKPEGVVGDTKQIWRLYIKVREMIAFSSKILSFTWSKSSLLGFFFFNFRKLIKYRQIKKIYKKRLIRQIWQKRRKVLKLRVQQLIKDYLKLKGLTIFLVHSSWSSRDLFVFYLF